MEGGWGVETKPTRHVCCTSSINIGTIDAPELEIEQRGERIRDENVGSLGAEHRSLHKHNVSRRMGYTAQKEPRLVKRRASKQ